MSVKNSGSENRDAPDTAEIRAYLEERLPAEVARQFLDGSKGKDLLRAFQAEDCNRQDRLIEVLGSELEKSLTSGRRLQKQVKQLEHVTGDLKSSLQELSLLEEMVYEQWSAHHDMDAVLNGFTGLLKRCIPSLGISVFLINETTHDFEEASRGLLTKEQRKEMEERLEEGTFAWIIREGGPVVLPLPEELSLGGSLLIAPFIIEQMPLGVVCIFSAMSDAEYTPHHFQIFRGLVCRTSISIANARRYRQLREESISTSAMRDYMTLIVNNMNQGVIVISPEDRITVFNRTAELIFGREMDSLLYQPYGEVLPAQVTEVMQNLISRTRKAEGVNDYEFSFDRGEGVIFRLGFTTALLKSDSGDTGGVVITIRDLFTADELLRLRRREHSQDEAITKFRDDLREVEERLRRSEKLASIGEMAAGVAHEINNPLGSISGFIQLILMDCDEENGNSEYLNAMQVEVNRMKRIVEDMLSFARQQASNPGEFLPVDLNLVLSDTIRLMEPQTKMQHVEVKTRLAEGLPPIPALADRLKQVLINMVLNACQAMDKEEKILEISTSIALAEDGRQMLEIGFSDNGHGIRHEDRKRIFDPFFTTREQGQGTGLGLATCYGIIENHEGEIQVDSIWGEGTTFTILLPVGK